MAVVRDDAPTESRRMHLGTLFSVTTVVLAEHNLRGN
jgi:hypothetical protein